VTTRVRVQRRDGSIRVYEDGVHVATLAHAGVVFDRIVNVLDHPDRVIVADYSDWLTVIDVADPANPVILARVRPGREVTLPRSA
jgi:hypothetical protein